MLVAKYKVTLRNTKTGANRSLKYTMNDFSNQYEALMVVLEMVRDFDARAGELIEEIKLENVAISLGERGKKHERTC